MADGSSPVVRAYLEDAAQDLEILEFAIQRGNRLGAFHLQQAVEKLTKAIRVARGLNPTNDHEIDELLVGLQDDEPWRAPLAALTWVSRFATAYRYPSPKGGLKPAPDAERMRAAYAEIATLVVRARAELLG